MESIPNSGGVVGYPESTDSSPRSRGGDSWDEVYAPQGHAAAAGRIRLMCSFGGRIVPRPTDKSLCYLGGETRIVAVDRQTSLADVKARLARSLLGGRPFALKYQLPNEDLDSLISVSTDEDFDNLIDEYDRLVSSGSKTRIRVFLFPSPSSSSNASSVGSLLDDTSKSDTWFVDALNSAMAAGSGGSLDGSNPASVNCLLGLEDDSSVHSKMLPQAGAAAVERAVTPRQDVQSVPDSPMMDKNSSFGSASSAPSLANLPPIRVRPDDRVAGIENQFGHVAVADLHAQPSVVQPVVVSLVQPAPVISGMDGTGVRVYPDDDDKSDHGGGDRRTQQVVVDSAAAAAAARANYFDRSPPADPNRDVIMTGDAGHHRVALPVSDGGFVYAVHHPTQQQQLPPQPQTQPQQYIPASNAHYFQTPSGAAFMQVPSYYHPAPQPHGHPSMPAMYYFPVHQSPGQSYSIPAGATAAIPPNLADPTAAAKSAIPIGIPQATSTPTANLFRGNPVTPAATPASAPAGTGFAGMGYHHLMAHHHQMPASAMAGYGFEYPDPSRSVPQQSPQVFYSRAAPPQYDIGQGDAKPHQAS